MKKLLDNQFSFMIIFIISVVLAGMLFVMAIMLAAKILQIWASILGL